LLAHVARDQATSDQWPVADATYHEAIDLAREGGQRSTLVFALAGLSWLQARRGRETECRAHANEALSLARSLELGTFEIWATAALGELELALGAPRAAADRFEHQQRLMDALGITDPDLSPAPELAESYLLLGRRRDAEAVARGFAETAGAKGQPWSLARSHRALGLVAPAAAFTQQFERALELHERTPDVFEHARTRLAYGER